MTDAGVRLCDEDILADELRRARHALAYLKRAIGNDGMRELLAPDVAITTRIVAGWVEASKGRWAKRSVELLVPGPSAAGFHAWYNRAWAEGSEEAPRAGHPEHFISHALPGRAEVIENVGETELPWRILYEPLTEDEVLPIAWNHAFGVRFGSRIVDGEGRHVGYTFHELRDEPEGTRMLLTTVLPIAAPDEVAERHLRHYCVEFRNWAATASRRTVPAQDRRTKVIADGPG